MQCLLRASVLYILGNNTNSATSTPNRQNSWCSTCREVSPRVVSGGILLQLLAQISNSLSTLATIIRIAVGNENYTNAASSRQNLDAVCTEVMVVRASVGLKPSCITNVGSAIISMDPS